MIPDQNDSAVVLPFSHLTNMELAFEIESVRTELKNKMENNGFHESHQEYKREIKTDINVGEAIHQYYDSEEFNILSSKQLKGTLSLLQANIQRLSKNRGKLLAFLSTIDNRFDIIVLTEIGNDGDNYINRNLLSDYEAFIDLPKNNRCGRVAILVKRGYGDIIQREDLKITKTCDCDRCQMEDIWVEIKTGNENFILSAIYRHPNGNVEHFTNDLEESFSKLKIRQTCMMVGDINIDLMKYENNMTLDYFTTLSSYNFMPHISTPTRITHSSATLIDHIFVQLGGNHQASNITAGNLLTDISDHLPSFLMWNNHQIACNKPRPFIRLYSEQNVNNFKHALEQTEWNLLLNNGDVVICNEDYYNHINRLLNTRFPLVRLSRKRSKDKKWITTSLKQCVKQKDMLYKKQFKNASIENVTKYRIYKNILNSSLKQAEENFYQSIFLEKQKGITNFWKTFGETLNAKNKLQTTKIGNKQQSGYR